MQERPEACEDELIEEMNNALKDNEPSLTNPDNTTPPTW